MTPNLVIDVSTGLKPWQTTAIRAWMQTAPHIKMDFYSTKLGVPWPEQALHLPTANARILVSRNKREGRYVGRKPALEIDMAFIVFAGKTRHQREGECSFCMPLRARRCV